VLWDCPTIGHREQDTEQVDLVVLSDIRGSRATANVLRVKSEFATIFVISSSLGIRHAIPHFSQSLEIEIGDTRDTRPVTPDRLYN
jgi:hypothetical protein